MTQGPYLIYDADCGFCTRSALWISRTNIVFSCVAWQSIPRLDALSLTREDVSSAAVWVDRNGRLWLGADAIGKAIIMRGGAFGSVGRVILSKPVRPLAAAVYGRIAMNRHRMPGGSAACRMDQRPTG